MTVICKLIAFAYIFVKKYFNSYSKIICIKKKIKFAPGNGIVRKGFFSNSIKTGGLPTFPVYVLFTLLNFLEHHKVFQLSMLIVFLQ